MDFEISFYESVDGHCPVDNFLRELKQSDPKDHAAVLVGLLKLGQRQLHRSPLTKPLGDGLFELRHIGNLNTRVLWFFMVGRRIVAVHGIRHKAQAIPEQDLRLARHRRQDWLRRNE